MVRRHRGQDLRERRQWLSDDATGNRRVLALAICLALATQASPQGETRIAKDRELIGKVSTLIADTKFSAATELLRKRTADAPPTGFVWVLDFYRIQAECGLRNFEVATSLADALIARCMASEAKYAPWAAFQTHSELISAYTETGLLDRALIQVTKAKQALDRLSDAEQARSEPSLFRREMDLYLAKGWHERSAKAIKARLETKPEQVTAELKVVYAFSHVGLDRVGHGEGLSASLLDECLAIDTLRPDLRQTVIVKRLEVAIMKHDHDRVRALLELPPPLNPDRAGQWIALETRWRLIDKAAPEILEAQATRHRRALTQLLDEWDRAKRTEGGVGFLRFHRRRTVLGELIELELALDSEDGVARALEHVFAAQRRTSLATTLVKPGESASGDLARIQAELCCDGRGVLIYLSSPGIRRAFLIDEQSVETVTLGKLPAPDDLTERLSNLYSALSNLPFETDRSILDKIWTEVRALNPVFLPPRVREVLREWKGVTVSAPSFPSGVPLEVLPWDEGRLLGEVVPVANFSSLPAAVALKRRARTRPERGGARFFASLRPEQNIASQLGVTPHDVPTEWTDALRAIWGEDLTTETECATVDEFMRRDYASIGLLQLMGHGWYQGMREDPAGLALRPDPDHTDGILNRATVQALPSSPALVLLSSCRAGVAHERVGDDEVWNTLGGAFLARGSSAVLLGDLDLDVAHHWHFSEVLHRGLAEGLPVAEAARNARASIDDERSRFLHARLRVIGLGSHSLPPTIHMGARPWPVLISLALALMGIGIWWRRRT